MDDKLYVTVRVGLRSGLSLQIALMGRFCILFFIQNRGLQYASVRWIKPGKRLIILVLVEETKLSPRQKSSLRREGGFAVFRYIKFVMVHLQE